MGLEVFRHLVQSSDKFSCEKVYDRIPRPPWVHVSLGIFFLGQMFVRTTQHPIGASLEHQKQCRNLGPV